MQYFSWYDLRALSPAQAVGQFQNSAERNPSIIGATQNQRNQRGRPASINESNICFRTLESRHSSFRIR
jgi:hypothetical protein